MPPAMKPRSKQETHYIYVPQFNYLFNWFCYIHFAPHKISLFTKPTFLNFNLMHLACYDLPPKEIFNIFFFFFFVYIYIYIFSFICLSMKKKIVNMHIITSFSVVQLRGSSLNPCQLSTFHPNHL
jgi:hypothetical protein